MSKDVLRVYRGPVANLCASAILPLNDIDDTTWMEVPHVKAETNSMAERAFVWLVNHEFSVFMVIALVIVLFL